MNVPLEESVKPFEPLSYVVGWNNNHLLTASKKHPDSKNVPTPEEILFRYENENLSIRLIATGGSHTLVYTENKKLLSFGRNQFGQLGLGTTEDSLSLTEIKTDFLEDDEIISIGCGDRHSAIVTKKGRAFVFGSNSNGQLGVGEQNVVLSPFQVKILMNKRLCKVVCGSRHTIFVTKNGSMFATGMGSFGQLGNGENKDVIYPVSVEMDSWRVVDIKAKNNQNIALSEDYSVYIWGGKSFKEGRDQGSSNAVNIPRKVCQNILGRKIVDISTSGSFFEILATDGSVFIFGSPLIHAGYIKFLPNILKIVKTYADVEEQNSHLTDIEQHWRDELDLSPKHIVQSELCSDIIFYKLEFLPTDDKIIHIENAECVSYYVTENGKVLVLGESKQKEIGLGDEIVESLKPTVIESLNHVFVPKVIAGNWHAIFLTGSFANFKSRHLNYGQTLPKSLERIEEKIKQLKL